jgi:Bacterial Ig-like domain/Leishmanolysin
MVRRPVLDRLETRALFHTTVLDAAGNVMGHTEIYVPEGGLRVADVGRGATSDGAPGFQITLAFGGGLTATQQAVFTAAAARWQAIITTDLVDVGTIDDIRIDATGVTIDGPGNILGQAGPTAIRGSNQLPFTGEMEFDSADLASMEANGSLNNVITHEMGHVLGIGTLWDLKSLTINPNTTSWGYIGSNALTQYRSMISSTTATNVPVENLGGPGTAGGHWRESTFNNELMTGSINSGSNPLSRMSAASMIDLGYQGVNIDAAEAYTRTNAAPTIGTLNATPSTVPIGSNFTLSLTSATDSSGINRIDFFRETNSIAGLQSQGTITLDTVVGSITTGLSASISTTGLAAGTYTYYARIVDNFGMVSTAASRTVTISGVLPPATPAAPTLLTASDTGTSQSDGITNDETLTFEGTVEPAATVTLFAGATAVGSTTADALGDWEITTSALGEGSFSFTVTAANIGGTSQPSVAKLVTVDLSAPTTTTPTYDRLVTQDILLSFSEPVFSAATLAGASLFNQTTAQNVTINRVTGLLGTTSARVVSDAVLPDGNYLFTLAAGGVTDVAGNTLASPSTVTFRHLTGDGDDNGTVDFNDLLTLAQNYTQSGRTFAEGNYDYSVDGLVNFNDLLVLAQNYGTSLFSTQAITASSAPSKAAPAAGRRRGVELAIS